MKIKFSSKKLEKILTNDRLIKKHYTPLYYSLVSRLSQLQAARNLSVIPHTPPTRKHKLTGKYEGYWSIDLSKNYRLIFTTGDDQSVDEQEINEITILDIVDTH